MNTAASLRAMEINAEVILKATKVDGVYNADPKKDPTARRYKTLTYMDVLKQNLNVMDSTAISLCMDNKLPIVVFDLTHQGNIRKVVEAPESIGTLVGAAEIALFHSGRSSQSNGAKSLGTPPSSYYDACTPPSLVRLVTVVTAENLPHLACL